MQQPQLLVISGQLAAVDGCGVHAWGSPWLDSGTAVVAAPAPRYVSLMGYAQVQHQQRRQQQQELEPMIFAPGALLPLEQ